MELDRKSRKDGSAERFTVEKARRLVYETASNYMNRIQMKCRLYRPHVMAGYKDYETEQGLLRNIADIPDNWTPPLCAIYAASFLLERQIVVYKYRLDRPEHDTGSDMGICGDLKSPLLLCREFTGQWSRLWKVSLSVGELPSSDKRYKTEGAEKEPGISMVSFDDKPEVVPRTHQ